jgi:hypothetical protein
MTDNEATVTPGRALKGFVVAPNAGQRETLAVQRRRESRREEFAEQAKLATLLAEHLDPVCTYWTALENKPVSRLSGFLQRRRGVRSGVPDVEVIQQQPGSVLVVFVELKSHRGVASKAQKQARAEMLPAGALWIMARSARAAMVGLHRAGVRFRRPWQPPPLEPWEGPFTDPHQRLPQEPRVAAQRREEQRRWRQRQRERKAQQQWRERLHAHKAAEQASEPPPPDDRISPRAGRNVLCFHQEQKPNRDGRAQ